MDPFGHIQSKITTIDGTEVRGKVFSFSFLDSNAYLQVTSAYDPLVSQQIYDQQLAVEWSSAYDENGYMYWYNSVTGVSQYEEPLGV